MGGPINYTSQAPPPAYRCATCGAHGVKLWREYMTSVDDPELACCDCAGKNQAVDVGRIDANGTLPSGYGDRTDQIGWRVPAVPMENGQTFWPYTTAPPDACEWWRRLPSRKRKGTS